MTRMYILLPEKSAGFAHRQRIYSHSRFLSLATFTLARRFAPQDGEFLATASFDGKAKVSKLGGCGRTGDEIESCGLKRMLVRRNGDVDSCW